LIYVLYEHPILLTKSCPTLLSPSKPQPKHIASELDWTSDTIVLKHFFEEFSPPKKEKFSALTPLAHLHPSMEEELEIATTFSVSSSLLKETPIPKRTSKGPSLSYSEQEDNLLNPTFLPVTLLPPSYAPPTLQVISSDFFSPPVQLDVISDPSLFPKAPSTEPILLDAPVSISPQIAPYEETYVESTESKKSLVEPHDDLSSALIAQPSFAYIQDHSEFLTKSTWANINEYLPEELISAMEWNQDFEIQATIFPEQEGYVFSLAVTPKQDLHQQKMRQNFYFLIDVSSTVEKHKLSVFKRSVIKALTSLQQGDSFNIFLLDKKITKLSPSNIVVSPKNLHLAEDFLEKKMQEKNLFASLDLSQGLQDVLQHIDAEEEVHTAILLTNGKTSLNSTDLRKFLEKNQGKLTLFTAAVGQNNELTNLDMIGTLCGGKLFYSDTNASFPRKLASFVKGLQEPLAKNLTVSLMPVHPKARIEKIALPKQMPNLYNQEPFIIMGKLDRLCDLDLVLQGRSAEDQIFLKKVVHFEEATEALLSMKKLWYMQQKIGDYEKFVKEAKPTHLKHAKELLKAFYGKAFGE
jgi:hypothetical protein